MKNTLSNMELTKTQKIMLDMMLTDFYYTAVKENEDLKTDYDELCKLLKNLTK